LLCRTSPAKSRAGPSSASVYCYTSVDVCPAAETVGAGHTLTGTSTGSPTLAGTLAVTCAHSATKETTTSSSTVTIDSLTFSTCHVTGSTTPCTVAGGTVTTNAIVAHADWMEGEGAYVRFEPAGGPTTAFATVSITGCEALNTNLVVKGLVYGKALNNTGVPAVERAHAQSDSTTHAAHYQQHCQSTAERWHGSTYIKTSNARD